MTNTPAQGMTVESILKQYESDLDEASIRSMCGRDADSYFAEADERAKAALSALIDQIIGEDDIYTPEHDSPITRFQQGRMAAFNYLRREQRQRKQAMFGEPGDVS